ncbi:MAG: HYR domain-containing protein, partial [Phaeodactylibacter sp.]|nr:HYR domain-containing protein [Phaeodactylibacter sp.]
PVTNATAAIFNGNDAIELFNTALNAPADIIGRIGEDPGTQWSAGGNSTQDQTLRRKSTVTGGVTANPASGFPTLATEWDALGTNVIADLGTHGIGATVTLTATGMGGVQTSCLAVVTVVDATAPSPDCQDITVDIEAGGTYTLTAEDVNEASSDNCSVNLSIPATVFDCNDVGSTVNVTLTITDDSGNLASCSADVTVADGNNICNQAPTASCQPVTVNADANCQGTAAAIDFDGGSTDPEMGMLSFGVSPAGPYPLGTTNVTLTVTDPGGATDNCMTTVTVVDNSAPSITCPGNFAINADAQCQALVPNFTGGPIVLANSVTEFSETQGSGGWSYGQYFAFDAGNFSQLPAYNNGVPQWQDNQAFSTPFLDAFGGHPGTDDLKWAVRRWVSPYTGTVDIGLAFYDRDGNCGDGAHVRVLLNGTQIWEYLNIPTTLVTQSISQAITAGDVIDFVIDPKFDGGCDNTQFTTLITAPNALSTSDNCGQVIVTQSPAPGTPVSAGVTLITLTADDGSSTPQSCTFNLNVLDVTPPAAACQPATVQLSSAGAGSITPAEVFDAANSSDNCGVVNPVSVSPTSFSCSDVGSATVTLTVSDDNGNTSTCSAAVTVNAYAEELCGDGIDNDCDGLVDDDDPSATGQSAWYADMDNDTYGDPDNSTLACEQPAGFVADNTDCDDTDSAVNPGAQEACNGTDDDCDNLVDEEDPSLIDNTSPTAACQPATVNLNTSGAGSITAADVFDSVNSSDNCGTVNPQSVSPSNFSCADVGAVTVTLTANDGNGNTSACQATVTVEDPTGFCSQVFCFDGETEALIIYVEGLGINPKIARAIIKRLELTAYKFCLGASPGTVISALNSIISYVEYQRGRSIPASDADYIIAEAEGLIDALNVGTAECCSGIPRPAPPTATAEIAASYEMDVAPNPFRDETTIRFYLPEAGPASLEVFSLQGQRVATLLTGTLDAGYYTQEWDGTAEGGRLSAGVYLIRLRTEEAVLVKKASLVR